MRGATKVACRNRTFEGEVPIATPSIDRRSFLASSSVSVLAIAIGGCGVSSSIDARQEQALLQMAQHLYPHEGLASSEFKASIAALVSSVRSDPQLAERVGQGITALDKQAGGDWLRAAGPRQAEALASLEQSSFFTEVQTKVRVELYNRPAAWEIIGYEGPSVEYGGYLERGYDDIDWLPEK
ncbi:hypothetical protein [Erythrobacter mangrovi]|uniref:Gluconate 2-dehydrogenase subunit 3 family protein n=1 Tax=Erythrobacter mangrovi TaxID=2739433 RepID=A0A7D3XG26_9SPHN|nr:hypothetical protein [Erythrobacter mangrovi]QKG69978.1 hypothetical protein HQR01_00535 [Erythrobacter mangrovi]